MTKDICTYSQGRDKFSHITIAGSFDTMFTPSVHAHKGVTGKSSS